MRRLLLVILVLHLSGCAHYQWVKDGATQSDFARDSYECQKEAALLYPAQVVTRQLMSGYTTDATTSCTGSGSTFGNSTYNNLNCTTTPGRYIAPVTYEADVNATNRAESAKSCMYARGWQRIKIRQ